MNDQWTIEQNGSASCEYMALDSFDKIQKALRPIVIVGLLILSATIALGPQQKKHDQTKERLAQIYKEIGAECTLSKASESDIRGTYSHFSCDGAPRDC